MALIKPGSLTVGFTPSAPANGPSTQAVNAAATWVAFSFIAKSTNVNEIHAYISTVTGTVAAADITCEIYSDSSGVPGSSIESKNCSTAPSAAGFYKWTGFSTAYTAGTQYWAVFKNVNGTPASNNVTFRFPSNGTFPFWTSGGNVTYGYNKRHTTNSGTAWTAGNIAGCPGIIIVYDTGSTPQYDGFAHNTIGTESADSVYSTREMGVKFTTPTNGKFRVIGATFFVFRNGTPTGNLRYRLYSGTTLLDTTTNVVANTNTTNGSAQWIQLYFSTTNVLASNTVHRLVVAESSQSDTSSNYYSSYKYTIGTDTGYSSLLPFNGTFQKTYYDGSSWTDTASIIYPCALILENEEALDAAAGGGGGAHSMGFFG
jgi:hypothetical protein